MLPKMRWMVGRFRFNKWRISYNVSKLASSDVGNNPSPSQIAPPLVCISSVQTKSRWRWIGTLCWFTIAYMTDSTSGQVTTSMISPRKLILTSKFVVFSSKCRAVIPIDLVPFSLISSPRLIADSVTSPTSNSTLDNVLTSIVLKVFQTLVDLTLFKWFWLYRWK